MKPAPAGGSRQDADLTYVEYLDMYYSDSFFEGPSTEFSPHLATLSAIMTYETMVEGNPASKDDAEWYAAQPERLKRFFDSIGFGSFGCNDDYRKPTAFDTIGVAAAFKIMEGRPLVVLTLRSGGYFSEWGNNFWLGDGSKSDYMHEGWYNAALKALAFLRGYIAENGISGDIRLWVSGYSRGGATANLIAGLLDNAIADGKSPLGDGVNLAHGDLYAYTVEAPQGANTNSKTVRPPRDPVYGNIWNVVHPNDLVTKVAMCEWGFTRFGTDLFITTRFYDPDNFERNRDIVKRIYGDAEVVDYADNLKMYGLPTENQALLHTSLHGLLTRDDTPIWTSTWGKLLNTSVAVIAALHTDVRKVNYDANITTMLMMESLTRAIGSRKNYCEKCQTPLCDTLLHFMDDSMQGVDVEELNTLGKIMSLFTLDAALGRGFSLAAQTTAHLKKEDKEAAKVAIDALFPYVEKAYGEIPNELVTFAINAECVLTNHFPDLIIAHMKAQDSIYVDALNAGADGPDGLISLVPLREGADYARATFLGFNTMRLYDGGDGKAVEIKGNLWGRSSVETCLPGYAAGYYSFANGEKMELFFPADHPYKLEMQCLSKKMWYHSMEYDLYLQHIGVGDDGTVKRRVAKYHTLGWKSSNTFTDESPVPVAEKTAGESPKPRIS